MAIDFKKFPELRNKDLDVYYFQSPHRQIFEDFRAKVVEVHDGDTITVLWYGRDFPFRIRMIGTDAPELSEPGGFTSRDWLRDRIIGEEVDLEMDRDNRVGKWGRLLAVVKHKGIDMNELSITMGFATTFEQRNEGSIPTIEEVLGSAVIQ